jgi:DNA-binding transcriptional regulator YiaG
MPNLSSLFKAEFSRLARKEVRVEIAPLKRSNASLRSEVASLKKQLRAMQAELKTARSDAKRRPAGEPTEAGPKFRYRATSLKAHRTKVGLSAKDYGRLLGVSALSVYKWEDGKVKPRERILPKIGAVLRMGKREALRTLEAMSGD